MTELKRIFFKFATGVIFLSIIFSTFGFTWGSKLPETILPEEIVRAILNEVSGQLAFNSEVMMAGYNHIRPEEEFKTIFYEAEYLTEKLKEYGLDEVRFEDLAKGDDQNGRWWAGEDAELWMIEPEVKRLSRLEEHPALMVRNCDAGEWEGEVVYVDMRDLPELKNVDVKGKIILTPESSSWFGTAFEKGALGVISYHSTGRSFYDPYQVGFNMRISKGKIKDKVFAFNIWPHLGEQLKRSIFRKQKVVLRATAKTKSYPYKLDTVFACIKGKKPEKKGFMFTAHLFERPLKQGANDNISGCVTLAEVARTITTLIKEGKIERPERSIYFLMGEEGSSTLAFFKKHPGMADKILGVINMDMVGENLEENFAFFNIEMPPYSKASFIGTVALSFTDYVYKTNMEKHVDYLGTPWVEFQVPIVEKNGSKQPFRFVTDKYKGGSDHSIFIESDSEIPALMFIIWPDLWYHTDRDRPDRSDPTQLKRSAFIGIGSALSICSGDEQILKNLIRATYADKLSFVQEAMTRSIAELSMLKKNDKGMAFANGMNNIEQSIMMSKKALGDIEELTRGKKKITRYLHDVTAHINNLAPFYAKNLKSYYKTAASLNGFKPEFAKPSPEQEKLKRMIPVKTKPVKLGERFPFRDIFAAARKEKVFIYKYGYDCLCELFFSINGKRTLEQIRRLLCFEFKPLLPADLIKIMKFLEEGKLIKIHGK